MSSDLAGSRNPIPIAVIGDGCAGLSLGAQADLLTGYALAIVAPRPELPETDHIWGMWQMDWLKDAVPLAQKTWHKWAIRSAKTEVLMHADSHPYHALARQTWLAHCKQRAAQHGVAFHDEMSKLADLPASRCLTADPRNGGQI